ncbi:MAG TPA: fumarate/nitrate reduction transcriptional regulator Fnr [Usitatibacter sp.]|nr:fumarate/nitrate reduction transcriptional regulator Fnr [Usitatibacter sp.]
MTAAAATALRPSPANTRRLTLVRANAPRARRVEVSRMPTRCSSCNLHELCLPCGLTDPDSALFDDMVYTRKRVKRGESLYRAGAAFDSLYAVRSGFFKSSVVLEDGRDQVTGFHMAGEILGMDGIGTDRHAADVIALEDSEVCVIPYARLADSGLQRQLHKVMSRELVRDQGVMMLLGTMRAEERLAAFLLNLSHRFLARGFSSHEFHLRMTRDEIGSYLGLSLETVSRLFSRFQEESLISVQQKHIVIHDIDGLKAVMVHVNE